MDSGFLAVLALGFMLIGLIGTVVPGIPGVPLVWLGALGYAVLDRFQHIGFFEIALITLLGALGTFAGFLGTQLGARAGGGSKWSALAGSCLLLTGLVFFTLPIALLAAIAGVFGIELRRRGSPGKAAQSSAGWFAGWVLAVLAEFLISILMISIFLASVLSHVSLRAV